MRKLAVILSIAIVLVWGLIYKLADEDIGFDPLLEEAIRAELDIGAKHLDKNSVKDVRVLNLENYQLTSIEGLQYFTGLQELYLSQNVISDATPIQNLNGLEILDLSFNQLTDLEIASPFLKELNVEGNRLYDLSFVRDLDDLMKLDLRDNEFSDLSPLADLTSLTHLNIRGNQIKSIDALAGLANLIDLNARNNQIKDVTPILELPLTERLYLDGNGIKDFNLLTEVAMRSAEIDFEMGMAPPVLSKESGYYPDPFRLEMEAGEGEKIYYTIDGSEPDVQSNVYGGPVEISKALLSEKKNYANVKTSPLREAFDFTTEEVQEAVTIKAAAYKNGKFGPSIVGTYFVNHDLFKRSNLPVIAITTDPDNLFDDQNGIYVPGIHYDPGYERSGNYYQRGKAAEKEAYMTFFEPDGSLGFQQDVGIRTHGSFTRVLPQKSLRIYPRSEYGQSRIYYPIYEGKERQEYDQLILRNSGNDFYFTMLRDGMMQKLIEHRGVVDTQDYRPAIVLLNGEYWGIHNIRERFTEEYLQVKYNVMSTEVALLNVDASEESGFAVDAGQPQDIGHYQQLVDYVNTHDLTEADHFDYVKTQMDVENYLEYVAYQVYFANMDSFSNNTAMWRKKVEYTPDAPLGHDGRWRWMLYDTDFGMGLRDIDESYDQETLMWVQRDHPSVDLFRGIIKNEEAKKFFVNTMLDLLNTSFSTENVTAKIDEFSKVIEAEMPFSIKRWDNVSSMDEWRDHLATMYEFAEKRPAVLKNHLIKRLHLGNLHYAKLTINAEDEAIESVKVNSLTLTPGGIWEGEYLGGIPVRLEVQLAEGKTLSPIEGMKEVGREADGTVTYEVRLTTDRALTLIGNE